MSEEPDDTAASGIRPVVTRAVAAEFLARRQLLAMGVGAGLALTIVAIIAFALLATLTSVSLIVLLAVAAAVVGTLAASMHTLQRYNYTSKLYRAALEFYPTSLEAHVHDLQDERDRLMAHSLGIRDNACPWGANRMACRDKASSCETAETSTCKCVIEATALQKLGYLNRELKVQPEANLVSTEDTEFEFD